MADFAVSCLRSDMDENITRLPIPPEKPADVASPYAISSSVSEAAKNYDEEFKKVHQSHGEALETSWKLISCGNRSGENASMQDVSRYQTCNRVTALQGDKNDADCTKSNNRCYMHEDMLFDIMLWLPVASLLRFRSVCKLWCSLIDSSTFITQHYNHNSDKSCLLAHHVVSSNNDADYDSKFCMLSGNKYEMYSNLDYKQPWYSVNEITILNSCNGIVSLLHNESENVALWNPATKQLRPLPKSSSLRKMTGEFGFGFDATSNDYKFVKIINRYEDKHNNLVEVYNLRTDSWRTIHKDDVLPFQYINCEKTICKNGTCFWTGYAHHDELSPILISFDLNNEVFETMPLPGERDLNTNMAYNALDLLNDKLCYIKGLYLGPYEIEHNFFDIWMLDEYGVKESWKKICKFGYTFSSDWHSPYVLGFSKNGKFLLLGSTFLGLVYICDGFRYGGLHLSNFEALEKDHLELQNPKPLPSKLVCCSELQNPIPKLLEFVNYNESLVSLKREDGAYK